MRTSPRVGRRSQSCCADFELQDGGADFCRRGGACVERIDAMFGDEGQDGSGGLAYDFCLPMRAFVDLVIV
jgi:hypothetical protein